MGDHGSHCEAETGKRRAAGPGAAAFASFNDLYTRCCPQGLEGAAVLVSGGVMAGGYVASDLFGAWLYEKGGFSLALGVSMAMNTLILAVLWLVPRHLITTRDGEALPTGEVAAPNGALPEPAAA